MNAAGLLANRVEAIGGAAKGLVNDAAGLDWATPVAPGTSPLGLTLWHLPRTVDWLVNTCIRDGAEVADGPEYGDLPDPEQFGFGTGLSLAAAADAAGQVSAEPLLRYVDAVVADAATWVRSLSDDDLDRTVDEFDERQRRRTAYNTPEALAEVSHLGGLSLGVLLARPAMSHLLMHLGEVDLLVQLAKTG